MTFDLRQASGPLTSATPNCLQGDKGKKKITITITKTKTFFIFNENEKINENDNDNENFNVCRLSVIDNNG